VSCPCERHRSGLGPVPSFISPANFVSRARRPRWLAACLRCRRSADRRLGRPAGERRRTRRINVSVAKRPRRWSSAGGRAPPVLGVVAVGSVSTWFNDGAVRTGSHPAVPPGASKGPGRRFDPRRRTCRSRWACGTVLCRVSGFRRLVAAGRFAGPSTPNRATPGTNEGAPRDVDVGRVVFRGPTRKRNNCLIDTLGPLVSRRSSPVPGNSVYVGVRNGSPVCMLQKSAAPPRPAWLLHDLFFARWRRYIRVVPGHRRGVSVSSCRTAGVVRGRLTRVRRIRGALGASTFKTRVLFARGVRREQVP